MNELTRSIRRSVWWGWGDPADAHPLSPSAWRTLTQHLGVTRAETPRLPVNQDDVTLPDSRLSPADLDALSEIVELRTDRETRIEHASGKSYPDIYRLRLGRPLSAPDAVAYPATAEEVAELLKICVERDLAVVPFGGGTSVVGGVTITAATQPQITVDLRKLNRLIAIDPLAQTATLEPGMRGPEVEAALQQHGFTLGHYPQSHQEATLGGYLASRSSGQASTGYGRPDERVLGLKLATPAGELALGGKAPASAAGPRLIDLVVGSEGTLGLITEATMQVTRMPKIKLHQAWAFPSLADGATALRRLSQELGHGWIPEICRLSDSEETWVNLTLAGRVGQTMQTYLRRRGQSDPCLLILVWEGDQRRVLRAKARRAKSILAATGRRLPSAITKAWEQGRFRGPYLRDELISHHILADTLETATTWDNLGRLHAAVRDALREALATEDQASIIMGHLSHIYPAGSSLYYTFIAPEGPDALAKWQAAKTAAGAAIVANGGTISHHHAVGSDHAAYLSAEIGSLGIATLRAVKHELDPTGIMNPGKLIP